MDAHFAKSGCGIFTEAVKGLDSARDQPFGVCTTASHTLGGAASTA
jgi:hypothetical protein